MTNKTIVWLGIAIILATGLIHLVEVPENLEEAAYKGALFLLNGIGAFVAAYGIYRAASWGWLLGLFVALGSIVGYVISRTVGLPGLGVDDWLEPLGVLSLVVEGLFVLIALYVWTKKGASASADGEAV